MALAPEVAGLVLFAAFLHASWNALLKSDVDRLVSMALVIASGAGVGLLAAPFVPLPGSEAWPFIVASVATHHFYYFFLFQAYRSGDLNHVYPIARGLGPLLVALLSGRFTGQALTASEAIGVLLVSCGIASLAFARGWPRGGERSPVTFAALTGLAIAVYTVVDGIGARRAGSVLGYIVWLHICDGPWVLILALVLRRRRLVPYLARYWWRGAGGGVIAMLGYGIVIWALSGGAMAHVAALRETSVIFASAIGTLVLRESLGHWRIGAAVVVASGLILMNLPLEE